MAVRLVVQLAFFVAAQEALYEAAHFAGRRGIQILARIDKIVTQVHLEPQHQLCVLPGLFLLFFVLGHGNQRL